MIWPRRPSRCVRSEARRRRMEWSSSSGTPATAGCRRPRWSPPSERRTPVRRLARRERRHGGGRGVAGRIAGRRRLRLRTGPGRLEHDRHPRGRGRTGILRRRNGARRGRPYPGFGGQPREPAGAGRGVRARRRRRGPRPADCGPSTALRATGSARQWPPMAISSGWARPPRMETGGDLRGHHGRRRLGVGSEGGRTPRRRCPARHPDRLRRGRARRRQPPCRLRAGQRDRHGRRPRQLVRRPHGLQGCRQVRGGDGRAGRLRQRRSDRLRVQPGGSRLLHAGVEAGRRARRARQRRLGLDGPGDEPRLRDHRAHRRDLLRGRHRPAQPGS